MIIDVKIVGVAKFDYKKDGVQHAAENVYFSFKDAKTTGEKTGSMFLSADTPDYNVFSDDSVIGKRARISAIFANNKTYYSFVDFVK